MWFKDRFSLVTRLLSSRQAALSNMDPMNLATTTWSLVCAELKNSQLKQNERRMWVDVGVQEENVISASWLVDVGCSSSRAVRRPAPNFWHFLSADGDGTFLTAVKDAAEDSWKDSVRQDNSVELDGSVTCLLATAECSDALELGNDWLRIERCKVKELMSCQHTVWLA